MTRSSIDRRAFLGALAAGAGATAATATACAQESPPFKADADLIARCEGLIGGNFTPEERAQMLASVDEGVASLRALAKTRFDNALAPADMFDPRLPGFALPAPRRGKKSLPEGAGPAPTNADDLAFAPAWRQAAWLRQGQLTSRALTQIYLDRIAALNPKLNAYIGLAPDALAAADRADAERRAGRAHSLLHGLPYALKDLFDAKGLKTTWGAEPYADRIAAADSAVVAKLQAAGCVLLGKTGVGALAYGDIWLGKTTRNPFNPDEGSSGSSAGSASAAAAGLCSFAIGTETLGSIVSPSHRCGTTGLRPTFGRVSRAGAMALCWSLDKVGPLCRSAWDTILVLDAINGADLADAGSIDAPLAFDPKFDVRSLKIGYDPAWFAGDNVAAPDRAALAAAKALGASLVEVKLPDLPFGQLGDIVVIEAAAAFEGLTLDNLDDQLTWQADQAWPNLFRAARFQTAIAHVQRSRLRRQTMQAMDALMAKADVLIHPNFAANLLLIGNMTGHPTLAFRSGFIERPTRTLFGAPANPGPQPMRRVPMATSLTGRLFDEGRLVALGAALEAALDVAKERPSLI